MTDRAGRTPLHYAALDGDLGLVDELLAADADVDASDRSGFTPLHFAAQDYQVDVVRRLITAAASIDPRNRFGATPLFVAVANSRGRGEVIKLLLDAGADPDAENDAGISPRVGANRIANYDVAQFFADA